MRSDKSEAVINAARKLISWRHGWFVGSHVDTEDDLADEANDIYNALVDAVQGLDGELPPEWE